MVEKAEAKKSRKVLVTGSQGMLGRVLCDELAVKYEVIGLDIARTPDAVNCDITDRKNTLERIINIKPDIIIHTAAWTDVDGCEKEPELARRINAYGTENVALAARRLGIPLVYISTDFVFDGSKKTPYTEEDAPRPLNVYARTKLEGEEKVKSLQNYIILRTSWMFGKNGRNFVEAVLAQAKAGKEIKVVDDQVGCPTYTKDLARAIGALLDCPGCCGIFHVSNKGAVSWFDYAKEILKLADVGDAALIPIKSSDLKRAAKRPPYSVLDSGKFERETGHMMRPWREALREYVTFVS